MTHFGSWLEMEILIIVLVFRVDEIFYELIEGNAMATSRRLSFIWTKEIVDVDSDSPPIFWIRHDFPSETRKKSSIWLPNEEEPLSVARFDGTVAVVLSILAIAPEQEKRYK